MSMYDTNIYKTARKKAGLTQEKAAAAIGVSVESLKAYEAYSRLPSFDVVGLMCIVYDAMYLAYQHDWLASGSIKVVPEVQVLDLPRASIQLINKVVRFAEQHRDRELLQIAEDGIIDDTERLLFDAILADLDDLVRAALNLKLSEEVHHHAEN